MSVRSEIEDGIRAWLVLAGASGGVPTADSAIIMADLDGPRPPAPYIVVKVVLYDVAVGQDEDLVDDASPPAFRVRGRRRATVSLNAFGNTAEGWLERAVFLLRSPAVQASLSSSGLSAQAIGGLNNLSGALDGSTQVRIQRDIEVYYLRVSQAGDEESVVELGTVEHVDEWAGSPDTRTVTHTEVLP